ncbi:MAG: hypothetical protein U1C46_09145 [Bacteroidales bacterium]|nr:hypothetical protein [Bacteroidales bacterium]MDZ4204970.1 hypothetical protein [Bacteroidales bacterium]
MKKISIKSMVLLLCLIFGATTLQAQGVLIRKMKDKVEKKIADDIFKDADKGNENKPVQGDDSESSSATRNRKGGGLSQNVPDVNQNIADAGAASDAKKYTEAKAAVRQALWGVELEIGQKILKSLPETVEGLKMDPGQDRVSSSGFGFVGLVIERVYLGKGDKELRTSIGNDAALLGMAKMYMAGGMYANTTDETNQKQIRYKDHNAVIRFDDDEGYTLSVAFGQSSVFVITGVNFDTEKDFVAAANNFDLNQIKKELGEQ